MNTDDGFIFEDKKQKEFLELDNYKFGTYKGVYDDVLFALSINMDNRNNIYERSYIKVPKIAAEVGGIISLTIPVIQVCYYLFLKNEYSLFLYYSFFRLQSIEENNNDESQDYVMIQKNRNNLNDKELADKVNIYINNNNIENKNGNISNNPNNYINHNNSSDILNKSRKSLHLRTLKIKDKDIVMNKEISKVIRHKDTNYKDINIIFCKRCSLLYCSQSKNNTNSLLKIINIADIELQNKFDHIKTSRYLDQFRLIKKLILNEGQCLMMNYRVLRTLTERTKPEEENNGEIENKTKDEIIEYVKSRKDSELLSPIDQLLINYLPKELSEKIKIDILN